MKNLARGRSFVTTGPMLYAKAAGQHPGHLFVSKEEAGVPLKMEVVSEKRLSYGEVLINGQPEILLRPRSQAKEGGGFRSELDTVVPVRRSGWFAVRFWEPREDGQSRFVHSAPWYVSVNDEPVRPRGEEKRFLIKRIEDKGLLYARKSAEQLATLLGVSRATIYNDLKQIRKNSAGPLPS